jgi:hypothetical protein
MNAKLKSFLIFILPQKIIIIGKSFLLARRNKKKPKKQIRFAINLVAHCNLNCKSCNHFSPLAKEEYYDLGSFTRDCERLSYLSNGTMDKIVFAGGEPLLHPEISKFLIISRKYFHTGEIEIITNGILLLRQPTSFWNICKENNIDIIVTRYPINIDIIAIKQMMDKYELKNEYWGEWEETEKKPFDKESLDITGAKNGVTNFKHCYKANTCIQLVDGNMYTCHTIPYIKYFNQHFGLNLNVTDKDYINIYKINRINKIHNFLCKPVPFCRYCNVENWVRQEWGISKKEISEWT